MHLVNGLDSLDGLAGSARRVSPSAARGRWARAGRPLALALATSLALALVACAATVAETEPTSGPAPEAEPEPAPAPPAQPRELISLATWSRQIADPESFEELSKQVGRERFVKLVIDLRTEDVYYFDVNVYPLHADFAFRELYPDAATPTRRASFRRNYGPKKTEFLLCTLSNHEAGDLWTFAFWEGDEMSRDHVAKAYERIRATFYAAERLRFLPASPFQIRLAKRLPKAVPWTTPDSLYKIAAQHTFNIGRRVGRLHIVKGVQDPSKIAFRPEEIVILEQALPEITPVSGIISERFSTPLSHMNLRAAAWGIPHIGLRGAAGKYVHLDGKIVFFEALEGGFTLREATADEAPLIDVGGKRSAISPIPVADLQARDLRPLKTMRAAEASAYGAKAANLGEITHAGLPWVRVPPGFGVPVVYYKEHLAAHALDQRVAAMLADERFGADVEHRRQALSELRQAIEAAPIDEVLLNQVVTKVAALGLPEGQGVFVRSSTNAEDLPGFIGAGLYTTTPNVIGRQALGEAIKRSWASVWNYRAYEERAFYGLAHDQVLGAVLVQVGMNATAAGVLVTANIFDVMDRDTYTINASSGLGMKVVSGEESAEQLLYDRARGAVKVLSRSAVDTMLVFDEAGGAGGIREVPNPDAGRAVLSDYRVYLLGEAAETIEKVFAGSGPLDIEWLFVGDALHIVQVRPYVTG